VGGNRGVDVHAEASAIADSTDLAVRLELHAVLIPRGHDDGAHAPQPHPRTPAGQ